MLRHFSMPYSLAGNRAEGSPFQAAIFRFCQGKPSGLMVVNLSQQNVGFGDYYHWPNG
jgi:hypothetical protein